MQTWGIPGTGLSYRTRLSGPPRGAAGEPRPLPSVNRVDPSSTPADHLLRLQGLLVGRERGEVDWTTRANPGKAPDEEDVDAFDAFARRVAIARFAKRIVEGDRAAWSEVLMEELSNEELPFGFSFDFGIEGDSDRVRISVELPPLDIVPEETDGEVMGARRRRDIHEDVCRALVLRVAHEVYRVIPEADDLVLTGYRGERDPKTGQRARAILVKFATDRDNFSQIDLDHVDPSDALEYLGGASTKRRGLLVPLGYEPEQEHHI